MQLEPAIVRGQFSSSDAVEGYSITFPAQEKSPRSGPRSLRQVDGEPIRTSLIPPINLGACMTQLLLNVALVNVGARSKSSEQAMPGEERNAIFLEQLAVDTSLRTVCLISSETYLSKKRA
tara:strand:- start:164 stop:526 length:363 start_codon:yes stop_codon:yes gene_type:complete